jgi:ligand-binding sensor domain-containing protein
MRIIQQEIITMRTPWHSLAVATIAAVAVSTALAQPSVATPEWEQFTPDHSGLTTTSVGILIADSSGGIWASGTGTDGIDRLNGLRWDHELDTRHIQSIAATHSGALWAFVDGNTMTRNTDGWASGSEGGFNEVDFMGYDRQDHLWAVFEPGISTLEITEAMVAHFDSEQWIGVTIPVTERITAFTVQPDGIAWVGTSTQGLFRVEGDSYTKMVAGESDIPSNNITTLALGSDGALWVGTASGLARYLNGKWDVIGEGESGLPTYYVRAIAPAHDNSVWVLSGERAAETNDPFVRIAGLERAMTVEPSFQTSKVNAIVVDRENKLWAAVDGIGVARYLGPAASVGAQQMNHMKLSAQVFPNPSSYSSTIRFTNTAAADATVEIVNERGEMITQLLNDYLPAGDHVVAWDGTAMNGSTVADGVYFCRIQSGNEQSMVPVMRLKQ